MTGATTPGNAFRRALGRPGAAAFSAAGFLMRLPISMMGLGIVLLVESRRGSYAVAGGVAAAYALVQAVVQPGLARLVDRVGQRPVLLGALPVEVAGVVALTVTAEEGPVAVLLMSAGVAGAAYVPVGPLVRARWAFLLRGTPLLHAAYSLESVLDEAIFIAGPVLVTLLATTIDPVAGLLVALVFLTTGTLFLAPQRDTEPPPRVGGDRRTGASAIQVPGVRVLTLTFVAVGGLFGSVEVATVAFADEQGHPSAAAVVLASFAAGSMLAGLAYGAVRWRASLDHRYVLAATCLGVAVTAFPLAPGTTVLAATAFGVGFTISPTLISGFGLVEELVPPAALTEGLTWASTGLGLGVALGSSTAGQVVDAGGARRAFVVTVVSGLLALAVARAGRRWLTPGERGDVGGASRAGAAPVRGPVG